MELPIIPDEIRQNQETAQIVRQLLFHTHFHAYFGPLGIGPLGLLIAAVLRADFVHTLFQVQQRIELELIPIEYFNLLSGIPNWQKRFSPRVNTFYFFSPKSVYSTLNLMES